ncbi:MAG: hypothetical protein ILO34_04785, partial [Kiritimatiellae bacterium]|nr:hypothetical protein [Kiritimatiellia bacterium]
WRDIGLDLARGVKQGPYKYRIDFLSGDGWKTLADASGNETDLFIDYRETMPATTSRLRLCVLDAPPGITPAIAEFTVFGE